MNFEDFKRRTLQIVQPLYRGTFETVSLVTAKLSGVIPFGAGEHYQTASPFGFISAPVRGVLAFIHNLNGAIQSPVILNHLHLTRPTPSAAGEVIVYCTNANGDSVPIQITLGNDGKLRIHASSQFLLDCDDIELGQGTLEKIVNGETFQTLFNGHKHLGNMGVPTGPPLTPMGTTHLSSKVKAKV